MKTRRVRKSASEGEKQERSAHLVVEDGPVSVRIYARTKRVKDRDYRVFELADYSSGVRQLRSFSDEGKAIEEGKRIAELMRKGDSEGLRLDGADRAVYVRASEHARALSIPLDVMAQRYAEAFSIMDGDFIVEAARSFAKRNPARWPKRSVSEAVAEYIKAKEGAGKSERHLQDLRHRLNKLSDAFTGSLSSVTGDLLQDWIGKMTKLSPRSKEHFRTRTASFFLWCKRQGYLPKDWDEVARVEKIKIVGGDVTVFTPDEAARLLHAAHDDFRPALAIQLFAGLRTAEVERLNWEDVNLAEGFITVKAGTAKTASRRVVPIVEALAAWLIPLKRENGLVWKGGKTTICDAQQATAARTVIAPKGDVEGKPAVKWKHNAARHSFISYRLAVTKNVNQLALEAGNSPTMIFQHYRELVREADAIRFFAIQPQQPANITRLQSKGRAAAVA